MNVVTLAAILGMAVGTYVTRIGGYWLVDRFELTAGVRAWLEYLPGAVLVSLILPRLADGGPPEWIAGGSALIVAVRTGNVLYAMVAGILVVVALRRLGSFA